MSRPVGSFEGIIDDGYKQFAYKTAPTSADVDSLLKDLTAQERHQRKLSRDQFPALYKVAHEYLDQYGLPYEGETEALDWQGEKTFVGFTDRLDGGAEDNEGDVIEGIDYDCGRRVPRARMLD